MGVKVKRTAEQKEEDKKDADRESFVLHLLQDKGVTSVVVSMSRDYGKTWVRFVQKGDGDGG